MPYCTECGGGVEPGQKFCPRCGAKQEEVSAGRHPEHDLLSNIVLAVMSLAGVTMLLSLLFANVLGFLIAAAIMVALYFFGFKKLEVQDYKIVQQLFLIVGIIAAIFSILALVMGDLVSVVIDIAVAALCFYGWDKIQKFMSIR